MPVVSHLADISTNLDPARPGATHLTLTADRLSALRHDLRTPFNQLIGYCEMVGEDAADANDDELVQLCEKLVRLAHATLTEMSNALSVEAELVTVVRLDDLRLTLEPHLMGLHLVQEEIRIHTEHATELPADITGNVERTSAALLNLVSLVTATADWHTDSAPQHVPAVPSSRERVEIVLKAAPETPAPSDMGTILVVDDNIENRDLLQQRLNREGFATFVASNGIDALALLDRESIDLVLLDVLMPEMDGMEVLQRVKGDARLRHLPIIMISALDEVERVAQCIQMGAEDYLSKPFNPVLLRARIDVTLERKRLRDEEHRQKLEMDRMLSELKAERETARKLLLNILPEKVADQLQQGTCAPMYFEDTTIGFTDFVGFTLSTESMAAEHVVEELHTFFTAFDLIMERYGLEKMKTIGDSYMFASGLPVRHPGNPVNAVLAAMELVEATERFSQRADAPGWKLRIGLHTGPVVAGVVGIRKFAFDIWGDSVNFASRMESSGEAGRINISERTYTRVKDFFLCEHRGKVFTKDKREVDMYFVRGIQPSLIADRTFDAFKRRYRLYFSEDAPSLPDFVLSSPQIT